MLAMLLERLISGSYSRSSSSLMRSSARTMDMFREGRISSWLPSLASPPCSPGASSSAAPMLCFRTISAAASRSRDHLLSDSSSPSFLPTPPPGPAVLAVVPASSKSLSPSSSSSPSSTSSSSLPEAPTGAPPDSGARSPAWRPRLPGGASSPRSDRTVGVLVRMWCRTTARRSGGMGSPISHILVEDSSLPAGRDPASHHRSKGDLRPSATAEGSR
mmetsp:Transcript_30890/g.89720  ORF Transcript_30890/g.89720 Transcript_30890/m.89720 type:complete len:217 (-) Transcript_30890:2226-2876(-)